jgi:ribosomal protein L24
VESIVILLLLTALALAPGAFGQTASLTPAPAERYVGVVAKVDSGIGALLVQLDAGGEKWIGVPPTLELLRISPGEKDIAKSVKIPFGEVRTGDRVLVRSAPDSGGVAVAAQVVVIAQADIARQQLAERADWKARGISGKVTAVNAETGEITITTAPRPVSATVAVNVTQKTEQRRYRPDSARFSDARPATLADVHVGDHVQALGNRGGDGKMLAAEKLVSGLFRNFAAKVEAVDPVRRELTVAPAEGGPPLLLKIGPACLLRKLPPDAAAALGARKPARPDDKNQRGPDSQSILESSPAVTLAELKPGDAVIVATGANGRQAGDIVPAIAVIAGAEPLLKRSSAAQRELLGSWELSLDPGTPGERGGQ